MEKITLKEAFKQASVVDDLKNFVGLDSQNALGLMTPERLAAVAGEKMGFLKEFIQNEENSNVVSVKCNCGLAFVINLYEGSCDLIVKNINTVRGVTGAFLDVRNRLYLTATNNTLDFNFNDENAKRIEVLWLARK